MSTVIFNFKISIFYIIIVIKGNIFVILLFINIIILFIKEKYRYNFYLIIFISYSKLFSWLYKIIPQVYNNEKYLYIFIFI